ncbi:MAG: hypothetical protein PXX77_00535 [Gallionella sp.]|nr:hypothetical protein [Gallionella sp.]
MNKYLFAFLPLFIATSANAAEVVPAAPAGGFAKVDFKKEIVSSNLKKLIGAHEGNLFFAKEDGSIDMVDGEGKLLLSVPTKNGNTVMLEQPEAVAIEGDTVYIVDSETDQVVMYGLSDRKFLGSFGGKSGGSSNNNLKSPRGIAVFEGVVYVSDSGNGRIQLFGVNGVFLNTMSISAPAAIVDESKGPAKALPFKLDEPGDIALDLAGRIYVLDAGDSLVKVYTPTGKFIKSLPKTGKLAALSVAEDGIYVADESASAIQKYDFDGNLAYSFGSKGEGKAQFKSMTGLSVDRGQQVFVGDSKKTLVNVFLTQAGSSLERLPKAAGKMSVKWMDSISSEVGQIVWDGKETIYAVGKDKKSLLRINKGAVSGEIKLEDMELTGVTVDKAGAVWVLDKKNMRGAKLDETGMVVVSLGGRGNGAGQFSDPTSIAVSASGLIFVSDKTNRSVQVFREDGVYLNSLGGTASKITAPISMSFDTLDNLYVLDGARGSVLVFSSSGQEIAEFGKTKEGGSSFTKPVALMATSAELLVLDGNQIKVFSQKGQLLRLFGDKGGAPGGLNDPVSITGGEGVTFLVSDRGNKRVQTFAVLHKPEAPSQFVVQGKVHGITLNWAQAATPYVKQYRIYRSKTESGGFVQIGSTPNNQFVDDDMAAGSRYYYLIAGESHFGYEGATSVLANGVSMKYTPPKMTDIKAEVTPWQIKINWPVVEQKYEAAYRIYRKEGDVFEKVAEVTQPEFIKDALTPDTKYTYYLSTLSTDGVESEKQEVVATTQAFNRAPLEIEVVKLSDIFSNSYKVYERDGIGRIKLTNNTSKPMEKIRVSFVLKDFMDFSTEGKVEKLLPGESEELVLKAVFNNSILTITEDSSVQAMIEASYFDNGKRMIYSKNPTVNVYDKHRLSWNERERFAAFVTPKDPPIINLVRAVVGEYKETKDEIQLAAGFFNALGVYGLTYIQDPSNPYQISSGNANAVDYLQFPRETLERKSGDCDDLVAFYSSGLESMGVNTRVLEVPGHMLMMFSTGIVADDDGYTMDNMYVIYEGVLWVPVETTLVGNSFIKAWENGSATYYKYKDKGLTILDVHSSWDTYKPASLPDSGWKASGIVRADIEKKFPSDHLSVLKISSQTKTRRYLAILQQNPADVDAHIQMGIILAKLGDRVEAMKYFDKAISLDAKNASAMNNRGNLLMIDDKYQDAQKAYLAASKLNPNDAQILVNLARAYKRTGDTKNAKAAFIKAQKLDAGVKDQYRALGLELLNAL